MFYYYKVEIDKLKPALIQQGCSTDHGHQTPQHTFFIFHIFIPERKVREKVSNNRLTFPCFDLSEILFALEIIQTHL